MNLLYYKKQDRFHHETIGYLENRQFLPTAYGACANLLKSQKPEKKTVLLCRMVWNRLNLYHSPCIKKKNSGN